MNRARKTGTMKRAGIVIKKETAKEGETGTKGGERKTMIAVETERGGMAMNGVTMNQDETKGEHLLANVLNQRGQEDHGQDLARETKKMRKKKSTKGDA